MDIQLHILTLKIANSLNVWKSLNPIAPRIDLQNNTSLRRRWIAQRSPLTLVGCLNFDQWKLNSMSKFMHWIPPIVDTVLIMLWLGVNFINSQEVHSPFLNITVLFLQFFIASSPWVRKIYLCFNTFHLLVHCQQKPLLIVDCNGASTIWIFLLVMVQAMIVKSIIDSSLLVMVQHNMNFLDNWLFILMKLLKNIRGKKIHCEKHTLDQ